MSSIDLHSLVEESLLCFGVSFFKKSIDFDIQVTRNGNVRVILKTDQTIQDALMNIPYTVEKPKNQGGRLV